MCTKSCRLALLIVSLEHALCGVTGVESLDRASDHTVMPRDTIPAFLQGVMQVPFPFPNSFIDQAPFHLLLWSIILQYAEKL